MLLNVNSYGLSHLCAFSIFEVGEEPFADLSLEYQFLDLHFKNDRANSQYNVEHNVDYYVDYYEEYIPEYNLEFYSRGFKYSKTIFNNLFEYLIMSEQHGFLD